TLPELQSDDFAAAAKRMGDDLLNAGQGQEAIRLVVQRRLLFGRLLDGELQATGILMGGRPDEPPVFIRPRLWRILTVDFARSTVRGPDFELVDVRVLPADSPTDSRDNSRDNSRGAAAIYSEIKAVVKNKGLGDVPREKAWKA